MSPMTQALVEALNKPSTLAALSRKTGYPVGRVLQSIIGARADGVRICAHYRPSLPTYYEVIK